MSLRSTEVYVVECHAGGKGTSRKPLCDYAPHFYRLETGDGAEVHLLPVSEGSNFFQVGNITLGCISTEARELLETITEQWGEFLVGIKKHSPDYTPTPHGLAYWLVRWSGLIQARGTVEEKK